MKEFGSSGFTGLNTISEPTTLQPFEFSKCENVWVNSSGEVLTRPGTSQVLQGSFHSLQGFDSFGLCVQNGILSYIHTDERTTSLKTLSSPNLPVSYAKIYDYVYWVNETENGKINLVSIENEDWEYDPDEYSGPVTNKEYFSPPFGHLIEYYKGSLWIASGRELWYSEPYALSWWRKSEKWVPMESGITMLSSTFAGLWVGTTDGIYSFRGYDPEDMVVQKVINDIPIGGTDIKLQGLDLRIVFGDNSLDFSQYGQTILVKCQEGEYILSDNVIYPLRRVKYGKHSRGSSAKVGDLVLTSIWS